MREVAIVTPAYRLFALDARMSLPAPGVLFVTIGSNVASKNIGLQAGSSAVSVSPPARPGMPRRWRRGRRRRRSKAAGVHFSTNLRAVRLLYGPVFSQNSFV